MEGFIPNMVRDRLRTLGIAGTEQPARQGFSGAMVLRIAGPDCDYCLRRWPSGVAPQRVAVVHQFMTDIREAGCEHVPALLPLGDRSTQLLSGGFLWDLSEWMPGESIASARLSKQEMHHAITALAQLHRASDSLTVTRRPPPAVSIRISRIDEIVKSNLMDQACAQADALSDLAQRTRTLWSRHHAAVRCRLAEVAPLATNTLWVLRDVHIDHILFAVGSGTVRPVVGIVDYDAVRIDTPATDLARLTRSMECSPEITDELLAVYRETRRFSLEEQRLVGLIDQATCLISAVNWAQWLCIEQRRFAAGHKMAVARFFSMVKHAEMVFPEG